VGSSSDETTMAGEENSWVGGGEGFLLLSRPREAMSSTKEGNAVIARGEEEGVEEGLGRPWRGREGDDGILAFKRMGVVKCRSPFGRLSWRGTRR
jgi:hypothetical protein